MKKISKFGLIISIIFSFLILFMNKIHFEGAIKANNYFLEIKWYEILITIIIIPIIYLLLNLIVKLYNKIDLDIIFKKEISKKEKIICNVFNIIFLGIIYGFYFLTFYPGLIFSDTYQSLSKILNPNILSSNQQPLLYTISLYIVKIFYPNLKLGFAVHNIIQILFMIGVLTYVINWLLNKNINYKICIVISIFFGIFNLYPLYAVSIWKDTSFSLIFLLLALNMIDIYMELFKNKIDNKKIFKMIILSFLISIMRNNGFFIITLNLLIFLINVIILNKTGKINISIIPLVKIIVSVLLIAEVILVIYKNLNTEKITNVGFISIPVQQVVYTVKNNGNIDLASEEMIKQVISYDDIYELSNPMLYDNISVSGIINGNYLLENKWKYLLLWFKLLVKNPDKYLESYLMETSGFWSLNIASYDGYIPENMENDSKIESITSDLLNIDFRELLKPKNYIASGIFVWIMIISMYVTYKLNNKRALTFYIIPFILYASIMFVTPIAISMRYVFSLVLMLPIFILYPLIFRYKINN